MATIDGAVFDSDHFTWNEPYLTINTSDCVGVPHVPPARESRSTQGHITSLVQPGDADWDDVVKKSIAWRKKIAKILVEDFMEINPGQRGVQQYILRDFPEGYTFYSCRRASEEGPRTNRYDSYLYGGSLVFRSPNEFVFHAAWLMDGAAPGQCSCRYCNRVSQSHLNHKRERSKEKIRERLRESKLRGYHIGRENNAMNRAAFLRNERAARRAGN